MAWFAIRLGRHNMSAQPDLTKVITAIADSVSEIDEEENEICEDCQDGDCQLIAHEFSDTDERRGR
jgi:hypothetical protein